MDKYYKILDIPNNSSKDDIRKAYKKMAMKWHPDKNRNDPNAGEKFKEISEAYEILMDDEKKNKINLNNFKRNPMSNNFSDPFEIFNKIFKDQNFNNVHSFNSFNNFSNNIHNVNNIFSFNTSANNPNIFSRSESIKTTFVNGKKRIQRTTQINNGKKSVIIEEDGKIISKQNFDENGKLIEN